MHVSEVSFTFAGSFDIPHVRCDASALALHADSGNLWTVTDDRCCLVEFTTQGEFVREVRLIGIEDAEGLCHARGGRFLIAEEKKMCVTLVEVFPSWDTAEPDGRCLYIDAKSKKNKGLEGVSYDPKTDTLYAVREDKPPAVFYIESLLSEDRSQAQEWSLDLTGLDDLSDTFFDPSSDWLWLVSHESRLAAALDADGSRVVEIELKRGRHGLPEDVEQAEGIVRDRLGDLYVCSEPNRVYRFRMEAR